MDDTNPYASPHAQQPTTVPAKANRRPLGALIGAYFGTTCAGGVFGLTGGILGVIIGLILASLTGAFVFAVTAVLARMTQHRVNTTLLGTAAGAITGFLSLSIFLIPGLVSMDWEGIFYGFAFALIPASLGAVGGFLGALTTRARR